jgi:hypothetical protein
VDRQLAEGSATGGHRQTAAAECSEQGDLLSVRPTVVPADSLRASAAAGRWGLSWHTDLNGKLYHKIGSAAAYHGYAARRCQPAA